VGRSGHRRRLRGRPADRAVAWPAERERESPADFCWGAEAREARVRAPPRLGQRRPPASRRSPCIAVRPRRRPTRRVHVTAAATVTRIVSRSRCRLPAGARPCYGPRPGHSMADSMAVRARIPGTLRLPRAGSSTGHAMARSAILMPGHAMARSAIRAMPWPGRPCRGLGGAHPGRPTRAREPPPVLRRAVHRRPSLPSLGAWVQSAGRGRYRGGWG
jgi:hypothetical protein